MKRKPQILIIEDNLIVAEDMRLTIRSLGYDVIGPAATGEEAFALISNHQTDLALVDIKLKSGENGIKVAKQLRFDHQIPVIYVTALTDDTTIEEIKKTEPYGYLTKPFKQAELKGAIETALYKNSIEHRLWESERQYRTLFETMLLGVVYQDRTGKILSVNPAAERILGLSTHELKKRTSRSPEWSALQPDGSPFPGERHPSMTALRTGKKVEDVVMGVYNPKQKEYRWLNVNAIPLFYPESNTPHQVYTTFEDITEKRNHSEKIEHLNSVLQALRVINTLMTHEQNREVLLTRSCSLLTEYRGYHHAYIALKDSEGNFTEVYGAESDKILSSFRETLQKKELPVCIKEVTEHGGLYVALQPSSECRGCPLSDEYQDSAAMSVTVKHDSRIYGVMAISIPKQFAHDNEEKELFKEIADNIGFSLFDLEQQNEKEQAEAARHIKEEQINTLYKLTQMQDTDIKEIINYGLEEAVRQTGSEIGYVHFIENDQVNISLFTWSRKVREQCNFAIESTHYPIERAGVWADCFRTKQPAIHNDYQTLEEKTGYPSGHVPIIRHMSVPVIDEGKVKMIAGVGNKKTHYTEEDTRHLGLFMQEIWKIVEKKKTQSAIKQNLEEKEVLLKEINHRVKNNLMIMKSLLTLQLEAKEHPDFRESALDYISRIHAMALVHERAYRSQRISRINSDEFIESVVHDIIGLRNPTICIEVSTEIERMALPIDTAVPCALILNELISNSIKHAFPDSATGNIDIQFHALPDAYYRLVVQDNGTGISTLFSESNPETLGMQLIHILIDQINGTYEITSNNGTKATITFPPPNPVRNKV